MAILDDIKMDTLPDDQYVKEETNKNTIYIHHTASSADAEGVRNYWASNEEAVGTAFIIAGRDTGTTKWKDGEIVQCFSSKYWAWHLGLKADKMPAGHAPSRQLNSQAIGIELCNWGYLSKNASGEFINYAGGKVPADQVVELEYNGQKYWHTYTEAQIESLRQLLLFLGDKWKIPLEYKGFEMFSLNDRAFKGEPGIWTHTSVRTDKWDCFPMPELITMLESLTS